ncbi:MAG: hypothetical protein ACM3XM_20225 [Mycobacterium leprae]
MESNAEKRASQRINATNPGQLNVQNASSGGIGDVSRAASAMNAGNLGQNLGRIQSGTITGGGAGAGVMNTNPDAWATVGMGNTDRGAGTLDEISQDAMQNSSVNVENLEEVSDGDLMQLMYEQAAELDAVNRISQERQNWKRQS